MLVAEEWPTFLYDETVEWSRRDIRSGLFRGHVLIRVSCPPRPLTSKLATLNNLQVALRMFRNSTAAQVDELGKWYNPKLKATGPKDFVTRCGITRVTPYMVAYSAIQTYCGLSSAKTWGAQDGTFNLIHFYHLIIQTLSDTEDKWVQDTLNWWQG